VTAIVKYLCNQNPEFLQKYDNDGYISLYYYFLYGLPLDLETISIMCETDKTIVTMKCQSPDDTIVDPGRLPLHRLMDGNGFYSTMSNTSVEADCFRYFLNLYPASAGVKDN
jgi:hypothetical protein